MAKPVARRAFGASHRVFDKHFKDKIKLTKDG